MAQEKTTVDYILYLVEALSAEERAELQRRLASEPLLSDTGRKNSDDVWGQFAEDADVLDQIVVEAMKERRRQFDNSLNA